MQSIEDVENLRIPLRDIATATNGFADTNIIGKGGFGNVYKGVLEKHGRIAVKQLDRELKQGEHEFRTEIALLSKYKHENIVSLLGFCDEDDHRLLVYKYESNGSLDKHVERKVLTWSQRLQIYLDAAQGLKYLLDNVGAQPRILHCDVKSANILLDKNWKAKISDFGLSKECPKNMRSFDISNPCGTEGYIDPDYYISRYLTSKVDVFSFGVVLWEVLCGRLAYNVYKEEGVSLFIYARKHYINRTLHHIIPFELYKDINTNSLRTFTNIAYQCLKNEQERPSMTQVVEQLQKALNYQVLGCCSLSDQEVRRPDAKRAEEEENPAIREENVDCKTCKVVVEGEKADPLKVLGKVRKENNPQVEFVSRVLEQPMEGPKKVEQEEKKDEEPEEKKPEEEAKWAPGEELKDPSQVIVLGASIDCEECARKVKKCLKGFEGVEDVHIDIESGKVLVKGNKADPLNILHEVHKTIRRKVELLPPVPKLWVEEHKNQIHQKLELMSLSTPKFWADEHKKPEQEQSPKQVMKHEAVVSPPVIMVILKVHMHCKACPKRIRACIMKMKGVESVVPDMNNSQVEVRGTVPAKDLVDRVYKKMGKKAEILKQDPNPKTKEAESGKHEK